MASSDTSRPTTAHDDAHAESSYLSSPTPSSTTNLTSSSSSASLRPAGVAGGGDHELDDDDDDDIWGSTPPSPSMLPQNRGSFPSADVARLRSTHTSAGYRDGLAAAKDAALQPGFDQGYSLGAALGVKAGAVVGLFQVLAAAVVGVGQGKGEGEGECEGGDGREAVVQFKALASQCQHELRRSSLLRDEYIDAEEGLWKWPVPDGADVLQVAAAHPLISRWQARADVVCETLGVSVDKLERRWLDEQGLEEGQTKASRVAVQRQKRQEDGQVTSARQVLDF